MNYLAIIEQESTPDGKDNFGITFPDFAGCVSVGNTIDEAIKNGTEALLFHIEGMRQDNETLPAPSSVDALTKSAEFAQDIASGIIAYIPVIPLAGHNKQVNFRLDAGLLSEMDRKADQLNINRTALVVASVTEYIQRS